MRLLDNATISIDIDINLGEDDDPLLDDIDSVRKCERNVTSDIGHKWLNHEPSQIVRIKKGDGPGELGSLKDLDYDLIRDGDEYATVRVDQKFVTPSE